MTRRTFFKGAVNAAVAAPFVLRHSYRLFAQPAPEYPERVVRLMRESLVIDMLNQFLYRIDQKGLKEKWLTQPGAFTATDFLRFKGTGVSVINFGEGADGFADAELIFAKWNSFIAQYPQWLARINDAADLMKAKDQGKLGILFGLQSSDQFQNLDDVNRCFGYGLRVSQLSYNFRTRVADGAFEPFDGGVSEYGGKVIDRMNSIGMAVDLGHASDKTKLEAIEIAPGDQRFFLPGDRAKFDAFKPPKEPRYSLLGSIDSLFLLRNDFRGALEPKDLERKVLVNSGMKSLGALTDLPSHAIVDRGRLVGLWEYDPATESIAWVSFVKKDKELKLAVTRTENFVRDQLGDARSFSLDSPKSRSPRIAALRQSAASA